MYFDAEFDYIAEKVPFGLSDQSTSYRRSLIEEELFFFIPWLSIHPYQFICPPFKCLLQHLSFFRCGIRWSVIPMHVLADGCPVLLEHHAVGARELSFAREWSPVGRKQNRRKSEGVFVERCWRGIDCCNTAIGGLMISRLMKHQ